MPFTILLTGFGPFPGAPTNPTGPLVRELARCRHSAFAGVRRIAHVFATSYDAVDRELPLLLAREKPDALLMFGLAARTQHLRIETRARNALTCTVPDAAGRRPQADVIAAGAPATLALRTAGQRLVAAARAAGMPAALSSDAGAYLCNYLCWRASETARPGAGPRLVAFVHVPKVHRASFKRSSAHRPPFTLDDLVRAGEAIVLAALAAARVRR
jgi:pyroglutamyl-peptidase